MQKTVAAIVPTLNEEKFIEKTLKALEDQTIPRNQYEIIVSDSSSNDNTVEIAKSIADRAVVCKRVGAGFGRNFGAKYASAPLLGFIDADTLANPHWVEGIQDSLKKGTFATGPLKPVEKGFQNSLVYTLWSWSSYWAILFGMPLVPGFNFVCRKKEFEKAGKFQESNVINEDFDLSMRLKKEGKAVFSKKLAVRTSARRIKEKSPFILLGEGFNYLLFKKQKTWQEHRKDY